jgi:ABC-type glycerol-3-phosphate transport system permease component
MPRDLEDASLVDGCNRASSLVRVIIPTARPVIATVAFFAFIVSWNEFVFARTVLVSSSQYTISVGLSTFFGQYIIQWNEIMAGSVIAIVPVVVAYFVVQRHLVGGLLAGAVKG